MSKKLSPLRPGETLLGDDRQRVKDFVKNAKQLDLKHDKRWSNSKDPFSNNSTNWEERCVSHCQACWLEANLAELEKILRRA